MAKRRRRPRRVLAVRTPTAPKTLEEAVSEQANAPFWNRVELLARHDTSSRLAEWNDTERAATLPAVLAEINRLADRTPNRRQRAAIDAFHDAVEAVIHHHGPVHVAERLAERLSETVGRLVSLRFDQHPLLGPWIAEWRQARERLGDKEALRWARQGWETGIERPHSHQEVQIASVINKAILKTIQARQLAEGRAKGAKRRLPAVRVKWGAIKEQLVTEGLINPQSLPSFTTWVVRQLSDLLEELPRRKPRRRRARPGS